MSSSSADAARLARLSKFYGQVLPGRRSIKNAADTNLFLEAICNEKDHQRCIEKLVGSSHALNALQSGLRFDVSLGFVNKNLAPFLHYLSDPVVKEVCNGQFLRKLLDIIVEPPTLWKILVASAKGRLLSEGALLGFAWLLCELVQIPGSTSPEILEDAQHAITDKLLLESESHAIRTYGHKIQHILLTRSVAVPHQYGITPGGRHDNDFEDFRQIAIFPTADEFLSTEKPFYRRADAISEAELDNRTAMHLDNQFRLLREDMLAELREDLQVATGKKKGKRPASILADLSVVGLFLGEEKKRRPVALAVTCNSGLEPLVLRPPGQRKIFLGDNRNFLKHQSFGCIVHGDTIVAFATLDRNENALLNDPPVVMLQIAGDEALKPVLFALKSKAHLRFILVDTATFAYEPILKCLQERVDLPLANELLAYGSIGPEQEDSLIPDYVMRAFEQNCDGSVQNVLETPKAIKLDQSQMQSLIAGLTHSLSLIQGPPGTGKSFIGALLAKAFHDYTKQTILVITYTNHALDQFLEDFLDIGIPANSIVRLGSKSTPRTASLNLSEQKVSHKHSQSVWSAINLQESELNEHQNSLMKDFNSYNSFSPRWYDIMEYLEFSEEYCSFAEVLKTPEAEEGMTMVDSRGKNVGPGYLYGRWSSGLNAGVFANNVAPEHQEYWLMNKPSRQTCIDKWTRELLQEEIANVCGSIQRFNKCQRQLDEARGERSRAILKQKRVIGCTTTAAAKYVRDLRSSSPGVIIVEEAGEILESHILSALSAETKRLVLIGDHKQLRPKVNNYALTVEKGDGYDLNRSLFERLVLGGHQHMTLNRQHRMSPEISCLVRHLTYPDLLDAPKTLERLQPRGLQSRVTFFNHDQPEANFERIADRRDEGAKASKRNIFEADLVLKIVRYMAQQGYGTDKLVVLTPYLGQLHLLRDQLSKDNDPILNDLDSFDLVRAGLLSQASAKLSQRPLRLSTIDNYQGEESDIVIASLTRSNSIGEIGFMAAPERLNVLLSRARIALIMIGNAETFIKGRRGKETWTPLFNKLKENQQLHDGLPMEVAPSLAEDREKERKKQRDHQLDIAREMKQKQYAQELQDLQDQMEQERRVLRERAEQTDQENVLRQHRQDLENIRRLARGSQKTQDIQGPVPASAKVSSASNPRPVGHTPGQRKEPSQQGAEDLDLQKSGAREEWLYQKTLEGTQNEELDSLMEMIGLEEVKSKFLTIKSKIDTAIRQNIDTKGERLGATLLGNPGTGKTTVARIYAKFLTSVGALPGSFFVESTGSRIANDGIAGCKKHIENILNNGGGVLFIDEAYQLTSAQNIGGGQVLDFLLAEVENLIGKVVFVLAGYNKQMETFFAHNPGLPSRFPHEIQFKDYTDDELLEILVQKISKKYSGRMELEDGIRGLYARIVSRRVGYSRGREGFGNARAVENVCSQIAERQASRIRRERRAGIAANDMLFTKEDLIGPEPSEALKGCKPWTELKNLIGLSAVKESVQALVASIEFNYERELEEQPLVEYTLNKVFLGSPGTGKTSVAKLYGRILAHIGLLTNGEGLELENPLCKE
ncbi:MAG: hypothetical protein Q9191_006073 [Dirinaria sp. TL-2023a]